jgi:hypothetical protein
MVSINKVDTNVSKLSTQNQVKVSFKKRTEVEWFVKCVMKDGNKIESTKKNLSVYPAPLYIKDCNQLQGINNNLNGTYILTNNIDCTGQSFVTIGKGQAFTGAIEGEGYKIIGLKINSTGINKETGSDDDLGLIGSTSGSINLGYAKIRNLTLSKVDINGDRSVGALIGDALGTTIENVTVDGKVFGSDHVGGLIGSASDVNLINCASSASISNAKNDVGGLIGFASNVIMTGSSSSASITNAGERIGGLVGYLNSGNVTKSKFTGKITINKNSTILNSDAGGIAGYASNSVRITDSSFTGSINGADCVGGIIGTIGAPIELSQNTSKGTLKSVGQKGIQIGCDFSK